ncbi:MAG: putative glutathione S-transferase [Lacrimispora sp.]|jgi:putative glutathione S-transferase|nr:putative glutathione S-transferase [Lacrimispora sp.]
MSEKFIKEEVQQDGTFKRQKNRFTTPFGAEEGNLPVEAGRYRLIWSPACPWAHRSVIVRRLLGLEDVISLGTLDPVRPDVGRTDWAFTLDEGGKDPVLGIQYLSEAYLKADENYSGRFTVPAVVDLTTGQVVNNDYFNLTKYWEVEWKKYHKPGTPDLYPENLRREIDELNEILYHEINNGVYKAGFARSQEAYNEAYNLVFSRLDWLEERLGKSRYLFGDSITESDVRLYVTLARFDSAYYNGFQLNRSRIIDFKNLWGYVRDLYSLPEFKETTDFEAIKKHYHLCAVAGNPYKIVPKGPDLNSWNTPHGRDKIQFHTGSSTAPRPRPKEIENEIDERGAFIRQPNHFTTPFGESEGELKAEIGRYRLFWAKGCHWSNRASIVRELLGLEEAIGINLVGHSKENSAYGWEFVYNEDRKDPVLKAQFLSEFYYNADPDYKGRCTVPALVDITTKKVVNNDYHRLTNYFETAFRPFQAVDAPDLYPVELRSEIDAYNDWLFPNVNNATYRMMFAQSITAYEEAFDDFYRALDQIEERLSASRFLFGDYVTDSDVRLFVTLARFDTHYYRNLGPIKRRVVDYENIWGYLRDLYVIPAFRNNTYFRDIAASRSDNKSLFQDFNSRFVDQIDYEGIWSAPQNRKQLSKTPEEKFKRQESVTK